MARVTNRSAQRIEYFGGTSSVASIVKPGTNTPLGGLFGMSFTAAGRTYAADPGGTIDIPIIAGTDDCRKDADYALPAGTYGVVLYIQAFGRSEETALELVE